MGSVIVTMLICIALFTVIYEMIRRATASLKNRKEWEEGAEEREKMHMAELQKEVFERMVYDRFAHYLQSALVIDQSKILAKKIWDSISCGQKADAKTKNIVVKWNLQAVVDNGKCHAIHSAFLEYYWNLSADNIILPEGIEAAHGLLRALTKLSCEHIKNNLDKSGIYAEFDLIATEKKENKARPEMNIDFSTPNPAYVYVAPRAL